VLENVLNGLIVALAPFNLFVSALGVALGIIVGAIPGLGPSMAISILVPVTFVMAPESGMLMLLGVFCGAVYGGSITAILLRVPGTSANIVTAWDGHAMARQGYPNKALAYAVVASFVGGMLSALALLLFSPLLATLTLRFGPPEYVALAIWGLGIIASLESASLLKGVISALLGLLVGTIGLDPQTGFSRFTFGNVNLFTGISSVPVLIGIFCIPELVALARAGTPLRRVEREQDPILLRWSEFKAAFPTMLRGGIIGVIIGALPAAGGTIAGFIAYDDAKRRSRHPEKFGTGIPEGICAPESANNGASASSLIPLITLGIPGSAAAVPFLGALTIHGLQPGPLLFENTPKLIYGFLAGGLIIQVFMLLLGQFGAPWFAGVARTSPAVLIPVITVFATVGAYALGSNLFDVALMIIAGVLGTLMRHYKFSAGAFVLALILGPLVESNIARSLAISYGSWSILFTRPIPLVIYALTLLMIVLPNLQQRRRTRAENKASA